MSKNTEIKFVGQPIFKQIVNLVDTVNIQSLVKKHQSFLSDSRTFGLTFKEVLLIDSTTIRLFSDILKGNGKKKGGMKVHMLIDAVQSVGRFIKITAAKVNDQNFLKSLELISHSMIVFDKLYNYYRQFAVWSEKQMQGDPPAVRLSLPYAWLPPRAYQLYNWFRLHKPSLRSLAGMIYP